jgi:ribosomal protein L22
MSAEEETTGSAPQDAGETPAKDTAAKKAPADEKRAAKAKAEKAAAKEPGEKKARPKKRSLKKAAAAKEATASKEPAAGKEPSAGKAPAAAKEAAAAKQSPAAKAPVPAKKPAPGKKEPALRKGGDAAKAPRRRVVRAHARYVRTSARKARMVCGHLRGKSIQEARAILAFTPREVARDWSKLLESAVANAESNHELLEDDLFVREAYADEGPTIKRFRPRAMGRASPIRKRTSHLTITLTPGSQPRTTKKKS